MPSTTQVLAFATLAAGLLAAAYLAALSRELVLAVGVVIAAITVAALFLGGDPNREMVAAVTMAVTVVYGVFTLQLAAAVVAACVVYLTLWVTGADGPFDATPPRLFPERAAGGGNEAGETVASERDEVGE